MARPIQIRIIERRIESAWGSFLYGFLEGFGRALGWMVVVAFVVFVLLPDDFFADSETPTETAAE